MGLLDSEGMERKLLSVFGGFLLLIVIGTKFISGNVGVYFASYLQEHGENITADDFILLVPLQEIGQVLTMALGAHITNHSNPWL
jgi:hypothetical protein